MSLTATTSKTKFQCKNGDTIVVNLINSHSDAQYTLHYNTSIITSSLVGDILTLTNTTTNYTANALSIEITIEDTYAQSVILNLSQDKTYLEIENNPVVFNELIKPNELVYKCKCSNNLVDHIQTAMLYNYFEFISFTYTSDNTADLIIKVQSYPDFTEFTNGTIFSIWCVDEDSTIIGEEEYGSAVYGYLPIWRDVIFSYHNSSSMPYDIIVENNVIYSGKANIKPNTSDLIEIPLNSICENYLHNSINFNETATPTLLNDYEKQFKIKYYIGDNFYEMVAVSFINDWSYNRELNYNSVYSKSILNRISKGQKFLLTWLTLNGQSPTLDWNGTHINLSMSGNGLYHYVKDVDLECGDYIKVNNERYNVIDCDYVIYYIDKSGGWNWLCVNGNVKKIDNNTLYSSKSTVYNTNSFTGYGKKNFVNVIVSTYEINICNLISSQSRLMSDLLESTEIYLENIKENEVYSVNCNMNNVEHLTYSNNGRKLINYKFMLETSQNKYNKN